MKLHKKLNKKEMKKFNLADCNLDWFMLGKYIKNGKAIIEFENHYGGIAERDLDGNFL